KERAKNARLPEARKRVDLPLGLGVTDRNNGWIFCGLGLSAFPVRPARLRLIADHFRHQKETLSGTQSTRAEDTCAAEKSGVRSSSPAQRDGWCAVRIHFGGRKRIGSACHIHIWHRMGRGEGAEGPFILLSCVAAVRPPCRRRIRSRAEGDMPTARSGGPS